MRHKSHKALLNTRKIKCRQTSCQWLNNLHILQPTHQSPPAPTPKEKKCRATPKLQPLRWLWQHRVLFQVNVFTRDVFPLRLSLCSCGLFTFTSFHRGDMFLSEWDETKVVHRARRPWQETSIWFPGLAVNSAEENGLYRRWSDRALSYLCSITWGPCCCVDKSSDAEL